MVPTLGWGTLAVALFHLAYATSTGWLILAFPFALLPLVGRLSARPGFYAGMALGFALYPPHLAFFWTIFGPAALVLWGVLAFWIGLFLGVGCALRDRLPRGVWIVALPVLWTGLEYFRCEIYSLRFSWLTPPFALRPDQSSSAAAALHVLGIHGISAVLITAGALFWYGRGLGRGAGPALALLLPWAPGRVVPGPDSLPEARPVMVAGAQIESASESAIPSVLDELRRRHPEAELLVLPEYSLAGEPDDLLRDWCRRHRRHLIVGGREVLASGDFSNTAFVIGPDGTILFRQAKSVPIQFFHDGRPAETQQVWNSPWGVIGLAVCYDLSYTRVMDRLIQLGAQVGIVPTMDDRTWGARQHALHARVAPLRAAEYGLPLVRIASSGISQWVDARGRITATAPFSDRIEWIGGPITPSAGGHRPLDRWLAPACTVATAGLMLALARGRIAGRRPGTLPRPLVPFS